MDYARAALSPSARPSSRGAPPLSAPPSPKGPPPQDALKSAAPSVCAWRARAQLPENPPRQIPSSVAPKFSDIFRRDARQRPQAQASANVDGRKQQVAAPRLRFYVANDAKQVVESMQAWRAQLGWDGLSEESWDALRARKIQLFPLNESQKTSSSVDNAGASAESITSPINPKSIKKVNNSLPLLPPKIKPTQLSSEYRVLKSSLRQAEERAGIILQALESSLADSEHMITLDPRWLAQFSEARDESAEYGPLELAVQKANKILDFLDRKQREQEACESMMQRLLETFSVDEKAQERKDFGQIVRPQNIAGATGDWDGVQSELEMQLLGKQSLARVPDAEGRVTDADAALREMENKHVQEIVKLARDLNIEHAKEMEIQRKEIEAKDKRIENIVATLGKVLNEREFLKNELHRAGHQNVIMKMKHAAVSERDMLRSIKDQITGKKSAAVEDRGMQTMEVQFADDKGSDSDAEPSVTVEERKSMKLQRKAIDASGQLAETLKNIYEADTKTKKKRPTKGGQDWTFMDLETFKKETLKQGTTFEAVVDDIKVPKEWQRSLKVGPKSGDDSRGRILTVRVLLKVISDIYLERFKAGSNAGPLVTFVQEYFLERYGLKELADIHLRNFVTSVIFYCKTDGSGGPGITRTVTFARLVGMYRGLGMAELEWYFSCRQDLFSHVDQLCCFDLDDSATKVTLSRAMDHSRRMFVALQMSAERAVRELDEIENTLKQPRSAFQLVATKKDAAQKFAEKVMRSNMKPIDLLLKQPEDLIDVDALFSRLLDTFNEDGDGEMDYDEFKALCENVGRGIKAPLLRAMFREMTDAAGELGSGITPEIFANVALKHNLDHMIGAPKGVDDDEDDNVGSWDALLDAWNTDNERILTAIATIPDPLPDSAKTKAMLRDSKIEMDDIMEKRDGLCGRRQAWAKYRHVMKKTSEVQRKNDILAKVARIMKGKKQKDKVTHAENLLRYVIRKRWIKLHLRDFQ